MERFNPDENQLSKSKPADNLKCWEKPALIQLDIKQTLALTSGCPPHQHEENGICVDN